MSGLLPRLWAIRPEALEAICADIARGDVRPAPEAAAGDGRPDRAAFERQGPLAIVSMSGPMSKNGGCCGRISMREVAASVRAAAADPGVRAVLLDVDSPGGTVDGVEELADVVASAAEQKPLYAYANGLMCSAAYWVSSAAREIAAPASAEIGSIGVVAMHFEISGLAEKTGVKFTVLTAGTYKAMGNMVEPLSDAARDYLQEGLDGVYELFLETVAKGRGVDMEKARAMADGKVFLAREALNAGLIDRVEGRESFINRIMQEVRMDLQQLRKEAPEALAEHRAEVERELGAKAAQERDAAVTAERERIMGLCSAVFGQEAADRVAGIINSGVTAEQAKAMSAVFSAPAAPTAQAEILKGLAAVTAGPVAPLPQAQPEPKGFDALVAERQKEAGCSRGEAVAHVARTNPEVHEAWKAAMRGEKE